MSVSVDRALGTGLAFTALEARPSRDTLAWAPHAGRSHAWKAGLDRGEGAPLLGAWEN